jgi:hypothetical protein
VLTEKLIIDDQNVFAQRLGQKTRQNSKSSTMAVSRARNDSRRSFRAVPTSAKKTTRSARRSASRPGILSMVLGSILPVCRLTEKSAVQREPWRTARIWASVRGSILRSGIPGCRQSAPPASRGRGPCPPGKSKGLCWANAAAAIRKGRMRVNTVVTKPLCLTGLKYGEPGGTRTRSGY